MCDWCGKYAGHYDWKNKKDKFQLPESWRKISRKECEDRDWCGTCDPISPIYPREMINSECQKIKQQNQNNRQKYLSQCGRNPVDTSVTFLLVQMKEEFVVAVVLLYVFVEYVN